MKSSEKLENELPDHIISYIFSKLVLKDLVKTSALSKQWIHEWGLRMDLNFDLYTMSDYNTNQDLPQILSLSQRFHFQSEFATRLDKFMLHYRGAMIRSIRVKFPLDNEHRDVIDRLISKGIAKGAEHIELLFSSEETSEETSETTDTTISILPYKFSLILLPDNDSLTYLHLQNCLLPRDLSGLKNLRTLVLELIDVEKTLIQTLCSNCSHLVDFTLDDCKITSKLIIISPSLLRLNIVNCGFYYRKLITIIASSLSSFEYSCIEHYTVHRMNIQAPMLSKFSFRGSEFSKRIGLSGLKNLTTIMFDAILLENLSTDILPHLFSECPQLEDVTFKNCLHISSIKITSSKLRRLIIVDCGRADDSPYDISIDALNLSSFEYTGYTTRIISFTAPRLSKVFWDTSERENTLHLFDPIASLPHIENLAMTISTLQVKELAKVLVQFQNLRQLELRIDGACDPSMDYFWLLDIATASRHLQKLTLSIKNLHPEHSHMVGLVGFKRQKSECTGFSHNNLKYVEFCGCVCSINIFELATHLLRGANSLKKMTFCSSYRVYLGGGRWTTYFNACGGDCWLGENVIQEMIKDEVNEQCQLIIL